MQFIVTCILGEFLAAVESDDAVVEMVRDGSPSTLQARLAAPLGATKFRNRAAQGLNREQHENAGHDCRDIKSGHRLAEASASSSLLSLSGTLRQGPPGGPRAQS